MSEIFDWQEEFRPLDDDAINALLSVASQMLVLQGNNALSPDERDAVASAAHQLPRLVAMAVGGHVLSSQALKHAEELSREVDRLTDLCTEADVDPLTSFSIANEAYKLFLSDMDDDSDA